MNIYTDGTTLATREQAEAFLASLDAQESAAARQATADTVQAIVDGNLKLSQYADLLASADAVDAAYVVVAFPVDAGTPKFWAGAAAQFAKDATATQLSPYSVRLRADVAQAFLVELAAVL